MVLLVGVLWASPVRGDEYTHQVQMTVTLLESSPDGFAKACLRLGGELTEGHEISKCKRGRSLLAIKQVEQRVSWAMIAYPSTPEDIEGLWQEAQKTFGRPDVTKEKELVWHLAGGVTASAGFDDEYSTFALARPPER